ncbi:MAG: S-layer homology domain-containing protein [Clostridiales bacterium]|nr:S-layer homology domain-containing protein [Clostridiales bacterium]
MSISHLKKCATHFFSLFLAALIILSLLPQAAYADDSASSIIVTISYQADDSGFIIAPRDFSVDSGLSERHGFEDSFGGASVSALDAIVAAHIAVFGDEDLSSCLAVDQSGFLNSFMGDGSGSFVFFVDDLMPDFPAGEIELGGGSSVELFSIQDTAYYSDTRAWFEIGGEKASELAVEAGEEFSLSVAGLFFAIFGEDYGAEEVLVDGAGIVPVEVSDGAGYFGEPLAVTSEAGEALLRFDSPGTYILSAIDVDGENMSPLMSPWLVVTVTEASAPIATDKAALHDMISQAQSLSQTNYTPESWNSLENALADALRVYSNQTAAQVDIDEALQILIDAIDALEDSEAENPPEPVDYEVALRDALAWIRANTPNPSFASAGGEWAVLALSRAGIADDAWYGKYLEALDETLASGAEATAWTDYERITLALTAMGLDASDYEGTDLTEAFRYYVPTDARIAGNQTIFADIYALIALDSKPYEGDSTQYAAAIADKQHSDGGWGLSPVSSVDETAMAVQALAKHYADPSVKEAVDNAVAWLERQAASDAEGNAQIIIAFSALGRDASIYVDRLLTYRDEASGSFLRSGRVNAMTTEQAACALAAYDRYMKNKSSLYDMSDAGGGETSPAGKAALNEAIASAESKSEADYSSDSWNAMLEKLSAAKLVSANPTATQEQVDAASSALLASLSALTPKEPAVSTDITVSFSLSGLNGAHNSEVWIPRISVTLPRGSTVKDLTDARLEAAGLSFTSKSGGNYISMINGLSEFDNGPYSGWMYRVNGVISRVGYRERLLINGDNVAWFYTDDYTKEVGSGQLSPPGSGGGGGYFDENSIGDIELEAEIEIEEEEDALPLEEAPDWISPYNDISRTDWFYSAVSYVTANGLMVGTGKGFEPNANLTRAMLAAILHRYEGLAFSGSLPFSDVVEGKWYTQAISWASEAGIVHGYGDGRFGPDDAITREQLLAILYSYAALKGVDVSRTADLSRYVDAESISPWAEAAMSWAVAQGVVLGRTLTELAPGSTATRAEAAMLIMNFIENFLA